MNGSVFSKARYMNGVGFKILACTPIPQLPQVTHWSSRGKATYFALFKRGDSSGRGIRAPHRAFLSRFSVIISITEVLLMGLIVMLGKIAVDGILKFFFFLSVYLSEHTVWFHVYCLLWRQFPKMRSPIFWKSKKKHLRFVICWIFLETVSKKFIFK